MSRALVIVGLALSLGACGGGSSSDTPQTQPVVVKQNAAPTAEAGTDQYMFVGQTITLNGSFSKDPDGDALTYSWSLVEKPAGSAAILQNPLTQKPTFVPDSPGVYKASLTVSDGKLSSAPATVKINIEIESSWSVDTSIDALTGATKQVLSLNGGGAAFQIYCTSLGRFYGVATNDITGSGLVGYRVGNGSVVSQLWTESPGTGFKFLQSPKFDLAFLQSLNRDVDLVFQYSLYLKGTQTVTWNSKNMWVAIEKTRSVCKWPIDTFPSHQ